MQNACMATSITIRNVPAETHDELAKRAGSKGQSLQEYLLGQLVALAKRPDESFWERVRERVERSGTHISAEQILEARDSDRK
jgi:antitoxin FitA